MNVTFFGHRNTPYSIKDELKGRIIELIENRKADTFYIGKGGNFDYIARECLKELEKDYPLIQVFTVLAYMPTENSGESTIFPSECATSHPKFAISRRNEWMIANSDIALTYVRHDWGGAWRYKRLALSKGLTVIEISEKN